MHDQNMAGINGCTLVDMDKRMKVFHEEAGIIEHTCRIGDKDSFPQLWRMLMDHGTCHNETNFIGLLRGKSFSVLRDRDAILAVLTPGNRNRRVPRLVLCLPNHLMSSFHR